jgi:hypothetical protein
MIKSSAKYGDSLTITPGVPSRPCLPWEPGARRLSLASHGIVARNRPRSSLPFFEYPHGVIKEVPPPLLYEFEHRLRVARSALKQG